MYLWDRRPLVVVPLSRVPLARRLSARGLARAAAVLAYVVFAADLIVSFGGVPASRDMLVPLLLGAVLAASIGSVTRLRRFIVGLLVDWLPLLLALWAYDLARGLGSHGWFPVHYGMQIRIDRVLGFGSVPTVWLQHHLWHGAAHIQWYDYASLAVYVSFFFATPVVLVALWWFRPAEFRRFAVTLVVLALAACATFLLFPTEPPWLAGQDGHIPRVAQLIGTLNMHLPLLHLDPLWERGTGYANVVAAVPSLHEGQTLLISLFFWRRLRTPWRHLLWLYPLAMAFALVYAGEHYVSDLLFGVVYCLVVYFGVERAWGWRRQRRAALALGPA